MLICRVVLEAGAILDEGDEDVEGVRRDLEISMKAGGITLFVTKEDEP